MSRRKLAVPGILLSAEAEIFLHLVGCMVAQWKIQQNFQLELNVFDHHQRQTEAVLVVCRQLLAERQKVEQEGLH